MDERKALSIHALHWTSYRTFGFAFTTRNNAGQYRQGSAFQHGLRPDRKINQHWEAAGLVSAVPWKGHVSALHVDEAPKRVSLNTPVSPSGLATVAVACKMEGANRTYMQVLVQSRHFPAAGAIIGRPALDPCNRHLICSNVRGEIAGAKQDCHEHDTELPMTLAIPLILFVAGNTTAPLLPFPKRAH
jgi:hypothetical protein